MLKKSLSSLLLGLILSIAVSDVSAKIVQRIVGGAIATQGRFKHQVSLQIFNGHCAHHFCGGSILDSRHIITAAHCVTQDSTGDIENKAITVVAGTQDLRDKNSGIYRDVYQIYMPSSYKLNSYQHDIAILWLKEPLPLGSGDRIRAVNLTAANQNLAGFTNTEFAVMSGFGVHYQFKNPYSATLTRGKNSPVLKYTYGRINSIPKVGNYGQCGVGKVCVTPLNPNKAGEGGGTCQGDSGGPLIDEPTNTLIGISSSTLKEKCGVVS